MLSLETNKLICILRRVIEGKGNLVRSIEKHPVMLLWDLLLLLPLSPFGTFAVNSLNMLTDQFYLEFDTADMLIPMIRYHKENNMVSLLYAIQI